jgi:predicted  nucleic acid-binding Zn-ribbon protein
MALHRAFHAIASSTRRSLISSASLCARPMSSSSDFSAEVDDINAKFAEAREEIDMAMDSKETVYFNEEAQSAREAVSLVLDKYQGLLDRLPDADKGALQRSMGLKMEQLKAELEQLNS